MVRGESSKMSRRTDRCPIRRAALNLGRYNLRVEADGPTLVGMARAEIASALAGRTDARMRAAQIADWAYRKATASYEAMSDVPASLRAELARSLPVHSLTVSRHARSGDGVDKLLVHGGDGEVFECVLLPYEKRTSCCISSQVGCPMGCKFCATGLGGFDRNLSAGEIVGQYLALQRLSPRRISHVVYMGMGEPLLNLEAVVKSLKLLHDEVGLSYRHMTVSTVGIAPKIRELAESALPIHLALSMHSPFDEIRDRLMPVNKRWPVAEVIGAVRDYQSATRRKITIEYLLIREVTDTLEQADELARLIRGMPNVVNLIPFNFVNTAEGFFRPGQARVRAFRRRLEQLGVNVTQRAERGHDIAAACGQLAGEHTGRFSRRERTSEIPVGA